MAIIKHIAMKSGNYTGAIHYLLFRHDEFTQKELTDEYGVPLLREEYYFDGINCEPYAFEKAGNPDFQLSICDENIHRMFPLHALATDLNSLSKVKDVDRRNEILAEATDSKNLKWKVEQAMNDEIREKNLAAFAALLEDAGIEQAKNVSSGDLYGNKWDTIKSFNLLDAVPESLFDGDGNEPADTEGLVYFIQYSCLKLIRKHKAEKRQPTESELAERRIRKSRKEVKGLYKQMHTEMASFVQALMNGQLSQPDDPSGLLTPLWHVIVSKEIYISASAIVSIMAGKESYQLPDDERISARERGRGLPLYMQMMAVAVKGCNDLELMDHNGHYSDMPAAILLTLYGCLNSIGFSFGNDEYGQVLDGTHELYEPWEDPAAETEDADDIPADDPSAGNAGITGSVDADEYESLLPEGFEEVTDMSEIPFSDGEPDMPAGAIEDEYPTVYSTEDGTAGISVVAQELASMDDAA